MKWNGRRWAIVVALTTAGMASSTQAVDRREPLLACVGLTDADVVRLENGRAVAKSLPSTERREVALAGAVRIDVPREYFLSRFRDIVAFKRGEMVLQMGRFSDPPGPSDVASLTVDAADFEAIRRCRVGRCGLKLSAGAIQRFRTEVDWTAADAHEQVTTIARRMLLENALDYIDGGDDALGAYNDKHKPVSLGVEFRALLENAGCAVDRAPDLFRYLVEFPRARPTGAESFIYWSKETFGLKPSVSLTHVVIQRSARDAPVVIATKGLNTTHYLDASLGLTFLLRTGPDETAVDVVYVNRSRVDALGGAFGGIARGIVEGRQRDGMLRELRALKTRLELDWQTAHEIHRSRGPFPIGPSAFHLH